MQLTDSPLTDSPLEFDEYDGKINEQSLKGFQDVEKKPASVTYVSSSKVYKCVFPNMLIIIIIFM
jgi:hypothetical protein